MISKCAALLLIALSVMDLCAQVIQQSDTTICKGQSVALSAIDPGTQPCQGADSVTDADGNVYPIVEIGSQCWMAENLRVSTGIPEVADSAQWVNIWGNYANSNGVIKEPAWCYYNNDSANGAIYGKLYNRFAVEFVNICPQGWHIPTELDWQELQQNNLGFNNPPSAGDFKATSGWLPPNTGATNSTGFTALPGGKRGDNAEYIGIGEFTHFWSSWFLGSGSRVLSLSYDNSQSGYYVYSSAANSVRCVKD